jgi:hypothetical protein
VSCQYFYIYAVSHLHREESSICEGIVHLFAWCKDSASQSATLDSILRCCADPSKILSDVIMVTLPVWGCSEFLYSGRFFSCISMCLQKLSALDCIPRSQRHIVDPNALLKQPKLLPDLVRILLQIGVDPNRIVTFGQSLLQCDLQSDLFKQLKSVPAGRGIRRKILGAVIEAGADVTYLDHGGLSAADFAWGCGHWNVWCKALQDNGLSIMEVDKSSPQGHLTPEYEYSSEEDEWEDSDMGDGTEDSGSDEWEDLDMGDGTEDSGSNEYMEN